MGDLPQKRKSQIDHCDYVTSQVESSDVVARAHCGGAWIATLAGMSTSLGSGVVLAAVALTACRDARAAVVTCQEYPIPLRPADGALLAARSELAAMSPGAALDWNANTGTLRAVSQFAFPLDSCTDGHDVNEEVAGVLAAHPALFQIDLAEWQTLPPFDCQFVDDATLTIGRQRLSRWG